LALILAAAFAGDVLHVTLDPHSDVPAVGASGGISGVIVFYALQFPHAKLGVMFRYFYYLFRWVTMSAFAALILWLALQIFGAFAQVGGFSRVSSLAHLGGAAVGFGLWLLYRWRQAPGENGKVR
jgi:membrane associated rhomboid family serine protease